MTSRLARAQVAIWALLCSAWTGAALARDALISPKERATSISVGDESYTPSNGFPLGPFRLHPFLQQRLDADDNVFLESSDTTWGLYYSATGGARIDLLPGNHEFTAGYKARGYALITSGGGPEVTGAQADIYQTRVDALTRLEHVADLSNALNFSWGRFELNGGWESLSDPLNFVTSKNIRRRVMRADVRGEAEFARLRFGAGGSAWKYDFDGAFDYLDNLETEVTADIGYLVAPKLSIGLEYDWTLISYDGMTAEEIALNGVHNDLEIHAVTAGVKGSITPRLDVTAMLGAAIQKAYGGSGEGGTSFFGHLRARWAATPLLALECAYIHDVQISQLASFQDVDRVEGKVGYWLGSNVFCRLYGYLENTTPSAGTGFLRYAVGIQARYYVTMWLSTGIGYEFRARSTSIPDADFTDNRAWIHLTVGF